MFGRYHPKVLVSPPSEWVQIPGGPGGPSWPGDPVMPGGPERPEGPGDPSGPEGSGVRISPSGT